MELRLTFKREEIANLYKESYESWDQESRSQWKSKRVTTIVFFGITLLTFGLTFVHFDWIYYGLTFSLITLVYTVRTRRQKSKADRETEKWKSDVDSFLNRYDGIDDIKYIYDHDKIQYFEQGKLVVEILWSNLIRMESYDQWISVYSKDSTQNMWIPRVIADEEELRLFEQTIDRNLKANAIAGS